MASFQGPGAARRRQARRLWFSWRLGWPRERAGAPWLCVPELPRVCSEQEVVSVSTDRLHTIAGEYKGKDDPVAIVRSQGIFPAPEEIVSPYVTAHYVAGDARGSHHMPLMPVGIDTPVAGPYCLPIVACMAYSVNREGILSDGLDIFGNVAWDATRLKAQQKGEELRRQGFVGPAMLPTQELEYSAFRTSLAELEKEFKER